MVVVVVVVVAIMPTRMIIHVPDHSHTRHRPRFKMKARTIRALPILLNLSIRRAAGGRDRRPRLKNLLVNNPRPQLALVPVVAGMHFREVHHRQLVLLGGRRILRKMLPWRGGCSAWKIVVGYSSNRGRRVLGNQSPIVVLERIGSSSSRVKCFLWNR